MNTHTYVNPIVQKYIHFAWVGNATSTSLHRSWVTAHSYPQVFKFVSIQPIVCLFLFLIMYSQNHTRQICVGWGVTVLTSLKYQFLLLVVKSKLRFENLLLTDFLSKNLFWPKLLFVAEALTSFVTTEEYPIFIAHILLSHVYKLCYES